MAEDKHVSFDPQTKSEDVDLQKDPVQNELEDMDTSPAIPFSRNMLQESSPPTMLERYQACMLLAGVGDALGYNMGYWEFCPSGPKIMNIIAEKYKGIVNLKPKQRSKFMLSDDTIMHIATAEALLSEWNSDYELFLQIAHHYVECMYDMAGRAPGGACMNGTWEIGNNLRNSKFDEDNPPYIIEYGRWKGGCGAAMRSVPIGLLYCREDQMDQLMKVSIESGRMTHHQSTGFLGSLATALLIHLAVRGVPPLTWGRIVLKQSCLALKYCKENDRYHYSYGYICKDWGYFQEKWTEYLTRRNLIEKDGPIDFKNDYWKDGDPQTPSYKNHDDFVREVSYSGFGGSSGHDAPMLAYDAVLFALNAREKEGRTKAWEMLCTYGMFHCGDSDSTGIISAAIWGAMFGFEAYESNYEDLEYKDRLLSLGEQLYHKSEALVRKAGNVESKNTVEDIGNDSELVSAENNAHNILTDSPTEEERDSKNKVKATGSVVPIKENDESKETEGDLMPMESNSQIGPSENNPSDHSANLASEEELKASGDSTKPLEEIGQSNETEKPLVSAVESDSSQIGASENNPSGHSANLASEEELKASGDSTKPLEEIGQSNETEKPLVSAVESDSSQIGASENNPPGHSTNLASEEELKASGDSTKPLEEIGQSNETEKPLVSAVESDSSQIGASENIPSGHSANLASEEELKASGDSTKPLEEIGQSNETEKPLVSAVESDSSQIGASENNPSGHSTNLASEEELKASGDSTKPPSGHSTDIAPEVS